MTDQGSPDDAARRLWECAADEAAGILAARAVDPHDEQELVEQLGLWQFCRRLRPELGQDEAMDRLGDDLRGCPPERLRGAVQAWVRPDDWLAEAGRLRDLVEAAAGDVDPGRGDEDGPDFAAIQAAIGDRALALIRSMDRGRLALLGLCRIAGTAPPSGLSTRIQAALDATTFAGDHVLLDASPWCQAVLDAAPPDLAKTDPELADTLDLPAAVLHGLAMVDGTTVDEGARSRPVLSFLPRLRASLAAATSPVTSHVGLEWRGRAGLRATCDVLAAGDEDATVRIRLWCAGLPLAGMDAGTLAIAAVRLGEAELPVHQGIAACSLGTLRRLLAAAPRADLWVRRGGRWEWWPLVAPADAH